MRITTASIVLFSSALASLCGCGAGSAAPPPQAVMHGPGKPPASTHQGPWTKADMIAVVQKSSASEDQKKAEIAKINAQPGP